MSEGRTITAGLFYETKAAASEVEAIYTLKEDDLERDGKVYPSLKRIYLSYDDPTEYQFAIDIFGTWKYWQMIQSSPAVKRYVQEWREELEVKTKSEALRETIKASKGTSSQAFAAAKFIATEGWKSKRGRPSKEEVERTKRVESRLSKDLSDDADRLGLH